MAAFPTDRAKGSPSIRVRVKFSQRTQKLGRKLAPGMYQLKLENDDGKCVAFEEIHEAAKPLSS
jgi:hypothetical protein